MHVRRLLMIGVLVGLLQACGGKIVIAPPPPPPPAADFALQIEVGADVNPDLSGRPSPVVLRVFVLADAVTFDKASLDELSGKPQDVLAAALLSEQRLLVRPGERKTLTLVASPTARHVGVTAEFADALGSGWRARLPVDPAAPPRNGLVVVVERNKVLLQQAQ